MEVDATAVSIAAPWWLAAGLVVLALALATAVLGARRRVRQLGARVAELQERISGMHRHDLLTGLMTRQDFDCVLDLAAEQADATRRPLTLLYVGIDGFREVNEAWGHRSGDTLLQHVADRLAMAAGDRAVGRIGGAEFVVLCRDDLDTACLLAQRVLQMLARPFSVEAQQLLVSASIGVAAYPQHGARSRLVINAGIAMRSVKSAGGGGHAVYSAALDEDPREMGQLRNDLRQAVERRQFEVLFQPKIDAHSLQVTAAEALVRWNHPTRGVVSPSVFVPLAERIGVMSAIGNWVIEEACRQAAHWRNQGLRMRVAVNLSGVQLREDDLVARICSALQRHGLQPGRFTCEITETVAMEDTQATQRAFNGLRAAGLHVSIDDFGTGYSSLASLRKLPAAEVKIDRAFVADLEHSADARAITLAVVQMAHTLELRVVAEGVETEGQRDLLVAMGCDELQGFLFAKPMTAQALALWASDDRPQSHPAFRESLFSETAPAPLAER